MEMVLLINFLLHEFMLVKWVFQEGLDAFWVLIFLRENFRINRVFQNNTILLWVTIIMFHMDFLNNNSFLNEIKINIETGESLGYNIDGCLDHVKEILQGHVARQRRL